MKTKEELMGELSDSYRNFSAYELCGTVYSGSTTITMTRCDDKTERMPNNGSKINGKGGITCFVFGVGDIV